MNNFCRIGILTASGITFASCVAPASRVSSRPPSQSPTVQAPPVTALKPKSKTLQTAEVRTVKFSKDGKFLLVGCEHSPIKNNRLLGSVQIYDASTRKIVKSWRLSDPVINAVLLPMQRVLLASNAQTQLWDWGKGKLLQEVKSDNIRSVLAVSSDETLALSGTTVYRTRSLKKQSHLNSKWEMFIRAAAFSSGGGRLVTGAWDAPKGIEAFDAKTGRLLWTGNGDSEGNVAWAPSGKVIGAVTTGGLQLYNADNGKLLRKLNDQYGGEITFLNDGKNLAYVSEHGLIVYEFSSGKIVKRLPLEKGFRNTISADGDTLAQVSHDGTQIRFEPLQIKF